MSEQTHQGPNMSTVYDQLAALATMVNGIDKNLSVIDTHLKGLITPPTLETRLKTYVDERDAHKQRNIEQTISDQTTILKLQQENTTLRLQSEIKDISLQATETEKHRLANHLENVKHNAATDRRLIRIERVLYIGYGVFLAALLYLKFHEVPMR